MIKNLTAISLLSYLALASVQAYPTPSQEPKVQKVYETANGQLLWIQNGSWTECGKTLIEALNHVGQEGLWVEDYTPITEALSKANLSTPEGQKQADEMLTMGGLFYISDMKGERLNPHLVDKTIYVKQVQVDEVDLLKQYLAKSNSCGWIQALQPQSPDYKNLKDKLAEYRKKEGSGGWPELPQGTKLQRGDKGQLVKTLRAQLIAQDVLLRDTAENESFDEALEEAVKKFQKIHGLDQDGKVGGATLTELNKTVGDRIRSLLVSLERQRWLPNPLPSKFIQVNIPGFYLKAVTNNQPSFTMPIITGKAHTKTPVFYATMSEVIFNPAWHVPPSITGEIASKMSSNPGGMAAKGYHWVGNSIVQSPGSANSLGKIRFTIEPTNFNIYLHGTPNQSLFQKTKRDLSHGCIRVEDPRKLAHFVFEEPDVWTADRIKHESSGSSTKRVKLEKSIPVYITYFTVFEDLDNNMHFVADEYGQDKRVWQALESVRRK